MTTKFTENDQCDSQEQVITLKSDVVIYTLPSGSKDTNMYKSMPLSLPRIKNKK